MISKIKACAKCKIEFEYFYNNSKYCDKCRKDAIIEKETTWRIKNKDRIKKKNKIYKKEYYIKNKNKIKEKANGYYLENKEALKEKAIKRREKDIVRQRENCKKWYRDNKDHVFMLVHLRKEKERKTKGFKDKIENFRKKMSEIGECIYCGSKENITIDHLIPISKGGTHEVYNLFPACRKCNSSKHAQDWIEWYRKQIFYSKDKENKILKMCC
jgi:5-methylcytosine-specific restriction endonuclease McrA